MWETFEAVAVIDVKTMLQRCLFSFFFLIFQVTNNSTLLFTLLHVASVRLTLLRLRPRLPEILFHAKKYTGISGSANESFYFIRIFYFNMIIKITLHRVIHFGS